MIMFVYEGVVVSLGSDVVASFDGEGNSLTFCYVSLSFWPAVSSLTSWVPTRSSESSSRCWFRRASKNSALQIRYGPTFALLIHFIKLVLCVLSGNDVVDSARIGQPGRDGHNAVCRAEPDADASRTLFRIQRRQKSSVDAAPKEHRSK